MKADNRDAFRADESAYLDKWHLTPAQKEGVLKRDYNALLDEGGNIYFLAKLFSTDGKSFQFAAGSMTGMTAGGLCRNDDRWRSLARRGAFA